jgi:predicted nuclease with TOPRIM domain
MKKEISEALVDFYKQVLAPEFGDIKKVQSEPSEKFIDVLGHFDSVYKRFDRLEDEYHAVTHGLKRIEDQLDGDLTKRKEIGARFLELKRQFVGMQLKLEAIEKEIARPS